MSFIKKYFLRSSKASSKTKRKKTADKQESPTLEAVGELKGAEDLLRKKTTFLEEKIAEQLDIARQHGTKNKRVALMALKRKARYEKTLQHLDKTLNSCEVQRDVLESAHSNSRVLNVLGYSSSALKGVQTNMGIDKVDDLMDDVKEELDVANEISYLISSPSSATFSYDEDELLRELEDMERMDKENVGDKPSKSTTHTHSVDVKRKGLKTTSATGGRRQLVTTS